MVPGQAFATSIAAWLAPQWVAGWGPQSGPLRATPATLHDGRGLHFSHNWSWGPLSVAAPSKLEEQSSARCSSQEAIFTLQASDVRFVVCQPEGTT
jgi:beta-galactosidase